MTTTTVDPLIINETANTKDGIKALAAKLKARADNAKDYVSFGKDMEYVVTPDGVRLAIDLGGVTGRVLFTPRPIFHDGLGQRLGIPAKYYDKMLDAAEQLLCDNVNHWLHVNGGEAHMVRTLGPYARACLSNSYGILDDIDVFLTAFTAATAIGAEPIKLMISESRMFGWFIHKDYEEEITYPGGGGSHQWMRARTETIVPLVSIGNSETGHSRFVTEIGVFNQACNNGAIGTRAIEKVHRGSALSAGFVSAETRRLEVATFLSTVKDAVTVAFDREAFKAYVQKMRDGTALTIEQPQTQITTLAEKIGLAEDEREALFNEFMSPTANVAHGPTVTALANALTFVAQGAADPNRQMELNRIGGQLLERPAEYVTVRR